MKFVQFLKSKTALFSVIGFLALALVIGVATAVNSKSAVPELVPRIQKSALPTPAVMVNEITLAGLGKEAAAEALAKYTELQEKALQGVGMSEAETADYSLAQKALTDCFIGGTLQEQTANCVAEKLKFLLEVKED